MFLEAISSSHKYANGSRNEMVAQINRGIADVGVAEFIMTNERSEVVAFTNTLGLLR